MDSSEDELPADDDGDLKAADGGWERNDAFRMGQRALDGVTSTAMPQLKIPRGSSLYEYALHFLPTNEQLLDSQLPHPAACHCQPVERYGLLPVRTHIHIFHV